MKALKVYVPAFEHFEVTRMETHDTQETVAVWACVGCRRRFEPVIVVDQDDGGAQAPNSQVILGSVESSVRPRAWLCELAMEDGTTRVQFTEEDPDGLRWNDAGEPSPYRKMPLFEHPSIEIARLNVGKSHLAAGLAAAEEERDALRVAAIQASFCLRTLAPDDADAQITVRLLHQALGRPAD